MKRFVEVDVDGNVICEIDTQSNGDQFSDESKYVDITEIVEGNRPRCGYKHTGGKNFINPARNLSSKREKVSGIFESMLGDDVLIEVSQQTKAKVITVLNSFDDYDKLDNLNGIFFRLTVGFIDENNGLPNEEEIDSLIVHSEKILQVMIEREGN